MKHVFKNQYQRKTTENSKVAIYILLAFLLRLYSYFKGINKQEPLLSPVSGIEKIQTYPNEVRKEDSWLEAMYQVIRWNESNNGTKGLAVTCAKKGKINETGFRAHQGFCFNGREEQEITVKQWLSDKITVKGMTKFRAMRLYTNNAPYSYLFN